MSQTLFVRVRQNKISVKVAKGGMTVNRLSTNDPEPVGTGNAPGSGPNASAEDHVHELPFSVVKTLLDNASDDVGLNGHNLKNLADPVDQQDAVTLAYFTANASSGGGEATSPRIELSESAIASPSYGDACYTNKGASGPVVIVLPTTAQIGSRRWRARFINVEGEKLTFATASGAELISWSGQTGESLSSSQAHTNIAIEFDGVDRFEVTGSSGLGWEFDSE